MKNTICAIMIVTSMILASTSFAETVFYKKNIKIESVNCENNTLVVGNFGRPQMPIRSDYDRDRFGDVCKALSKFAENNQDSKSSGKFITLLTTEKKSIGDFIFQQEVVGVLDIDNIIAAISADERDPVYTQYCGILGGSTRSSTRMCLMISNGGLYFVEIQSAQQYQLSKASVVSAEQTHLALESRDSKGKASINLTADKTDESTLAVTVSFDGGNPVYGILKK